MVCYCSKECQSQAWTSHKAECKKMRKLRKEKDASNKKIPYLKRSERARQFCFREKWAQAENEFRIMLLEDPSDAGMWGNLGRVLEAQGDVPGAIRCLTRSTQLGPHRADTHYNLGVTLQNCGKYAEALKAYDTCLKVDPSYVDARDNRDIVRAFTRGPQVTPSGVTMEAKQGPGGAYYSISATAPGY